MAGWRLVRVADALRELEKGQKGQQGKHYTSSLRLESLLTFCVYEIYMVL